MLTEMITEPQKLASGLFLATELNDGDITPLIFMQEIKKKDILWKHLYPETTRAVFQIPNEPTMLTTAKGLYRTAVNIADLVSAINTYIPNQLVEVDEVSYIQYEPSSYPFDGETSVFINPINIDLIIKDSYKDRTKIEMGQLTLTIKRHHFDVQRLIYT